MKDSQYTEQAAAAAEVPALKDGQARDDGTTSANTDRDTPAATSDDAQRDGTQEYAQ